MISTELNKKGIPRYWLTNQPKVCRKEELEQKDLNFHCAYKWPNEYRSMFHVGNESGGKSSSQWGQKLNDLGRKKGVSDWQVQVPIGKYHGLIIELKREIKSASTLGKEQSDYLVNQQSLGYYVAVCYGYKAALHVIDQYLKNLL